MTDIAQALVDSAPFLVLFLGTATSLLVFALAIRGIDWAPIMVVMSVPIQRSLLPGFGDHHVTFTQLWLIAFVGGAILRFATGRLSIRVDPVAVLFGAAALWMALSIVASPAPRGWAGETYRWLTPALFFVLARGYFERPSALRIGATVAALSVGVAAWALIQIVRDSGPESFHRNGLIRVYGGFGEPNPFAAFVVFCALVLLGATWVAPTMWWRVLFATGAVLGIATTVLSQSRGGLLALASGLGVLAFCALVRQPRLIRGSAICLVAVGAAVVVVGIVVREPWNLGEINVTSANWAELERAAHWKAAWAMTKAHPTFGVGAGAFNDHFRQYTTDWRFRISRGHAHNAYLQVAAESGVFGALVYLGLLAALCRRLVQSLVRLPYSIIAPGALAGTIALTIHQMFDYLNVLSLGLLYAGVWAATLALSDKELETRDSYRNP